MTTAAYTWQTPEYSYDFIPTENNLVRVQSDDKQAIENFLSTLELDCLEEGQELPTIEQEQIEFWGMELMYFVEVTRATISLFLDFDVRYYMGVPTP